MKYTVKIDYSNKATFSDWDSFINFIGYSLEGGLRKLEVDRVEDPEEVANEQ